MRNGLLWEGEIIGGKIMKYSISGYLQKYYGCMNHEEGITLEEAYDIVWDNAQHGLNSVIESEAQII